MRLPFMVFGVDLRGNDVTAGMMSQWSHRDRPNARLSHFPLPKLEQRGLAYTCRMFGDIVLGNLARLYPAQFGNLDILLPTPRGAERFIDPDSNVTHLVVDPDAMREAHVAVGLSASGLMLDIAQRRDQQVDVGRAFPLIELGALGPEAANLAVGDAVLRLLLQQHADVFAAFPPLSLQPQDRP